MRKALLIIINSFILSNVTFANNYTLEVNKEPDVCNFVFNEVRQSTSKPNHIFKTLFREIKWNKGSYKSTGAWSDIQSTNKVRYVEFDINNNGEKELLVKELTWEGGRPGDILHIFNNKKYDFTKSPFIKNETVIKFESIRPSMYQDFVLANINIFKYKKINYIATNDIYFNKEGYSRYLIISKYPKEVTFVKKPKSPLKSVDLDIICKIKS